LSHPDRSENCQGRIIYDAGNSVNVSDLEDRWWRNSLDIRTWYRLALQPTSERLAANWPLGLQLAPALGISSRQRKAFIQSEDRSVGTSLGVIVGVVRSVFAGDRTVVP
jgi:hypothetical protein